MKRFCQQIHNTPVKNYFRCVAPGVMPFSLYFKALPSCPLQLTALRKSDQVNTTNKIISLYQMGLSPFNSVTLCFVIAACHTVFYFNFYASCSLAKKAMYCTMCTARGDLGLLEELNGHHYLQQFGHSVQWPFIDNTK